MKRLRDEGFPANPRVPQAVVERCNAVVEGSGRSTVSEVRVEWCKQWISNIEISVLSNQEVSQPHGLMEVMYIVHVFLRSKNMLCCSRA